MYLLPFCYSYFIFFWLTLFSHLCPDCFPFLTARLTSHFSYGFILPVGVCHGWSLFLPAGFLPSFLAVSTTWHTDTVCPTVCRWFHLFNISETHVLVSCPSLLPSLFLTSTSPQAPQPRLPCPQAVTRSWWQAELPRTFNKYLLS